MGDMLHLRAGDGHDFQCYLATPPAGPKAGLIILQEVFGITDHIRRVADRYAGQGYTAIAPSLFDRIEPGIVLDYAEVERGRDIMLRLDRQETLLDIAATLEHVKTAGRIGAIGYCWGGAIADLAACELGIDAAVSYYGRAIIDWLDLSPQCPVLYHFGGTDPLIPMDTVERIQSARPGQVFHIYPDAGHGFNCDERHDYHPASASLALERTQQFLERHLQEQANET
jgi:carboxymethylenebutenolidase